MAKKPPPFEEWTSSEAFYRWFWKGTNGNELIDRLNMHNFNQQGDKGCDRIRRESDSPTIYGLVINNDMDLGDPDWKLCKVDFTHLSTKPVSDENCPKNQIEKDKAEIEKIFPEVTVSVIFALPINFIDTTQVSKVEERLRKRQCHRVSSRQRSCRINGSARENWMGPNNTAIHHSPEGKNW